MKKPTDSIEAPDGGRSSLAHGSPLLGRISEYLQLGGLFNPEMMEHEKVRDLIMACRDEISDLVKDRERRNWLEEQNGPRGRLPRCKRSSRTTPMSFADQLKDERKRLGLTQAGADAVLDTCRGQVAAWESGCFTPHVLTQEGAFARLRKRKTPRK